MTSIGLSRSGPPETILPPDDQRCTDALDAAKALTEGRKEAISEVTAQYPRSLQCWVAMGELASDRMERYSAYRVAYHRGLDLARASGWRGSGYIRWVHETNRPFLTALRELGRCAADIGEDDEAERIAHFVVQLDPEWASNPT